MREGAEFLLRYQCVLRNQKWMEMVYFSFFYKERIVSVNNCFPKRLLVNRMTFHSSISIIYIL